jgi:hypothetical protein
VTGADPDVRGSPFGTQLFGQALTEPPEKFVGFRASLVRVCAVGFGEHQQQEFGEVELSEDDLFEAGGFGGVEDVMDVLDCVYWGGVALEPNVEEFDGD